MEQAIVLLPIVLVLLVVLSYRIIPLRRKRVTIRAKPKELVQKWRSRSLHVKFGWRFVHAFLETLKTALLTVRATKELIIVLFEAVLLISTFYHYF